MQVNFLNSIISNRSINNYKCVVPELYPTFKGKTYQDTFLRNKDTFENFKYFTVDEYKQLSKSDIKKINEYIDKKYDGAFDETLLYHDVAAEGIKQTLDKICGVGNYVFIPIGRSVSSIGKCLSYKIGDDNVKLLPMSQATRFADLEKCTENIELFGKYLNSIGLSKQKIETSGKMYVFVDYSRSGKSLAAVENLITSDKVLGEHGNVAFVNVLHLLTNVQPGEINEDMKDVSNLEFRDKLEDMFDRGEYKQYSLVGRCENLGCTSQAVLKPEQYQEKSKCFWFTLLDYEMNK